MKKMKSILSLAIVFLLMLSNNVFAATTSSWDIKLVSIGNAERYYNSDGSIITYQEKNMINAQNGNEYTIIKPELYMRLNYIGALCVLNTYIDGTHAEHSNVLRTETTSNGYYADVVVRYLSPGKHKIEIYANSTTIMDTTLKKVTFYVNIPEYTDSEMEKSLQKINNGTATINDYEALCINTSKIFGNNGVDIAKVNEKVKGQNLNITNVQSTVYSIADELKNSKLSEDALKKINAGTASLSDYSTLGIEGVTSSNLSCVNSVIKITRDEKNQNLSKEEIQEIVNEIPSKLEEANTRINNGEGILKDYALVGATKVTEVNLEDINWYVKGKDNSTVSKLQSNINTVLNALSYINNGTTSTSYYTTLGITEINSNNITSVAVIVKTNKEKKGSDLTKTEIEQSVQYAISEVGNANERINAGQGKVLDYTMLGITNVTEVNLEDINWYVKGKDNSTISKLQSNVNTMKNTLYYINGASTSTSYYTTIGITTVNSNNIIAVANSIKEERAKKGSDLTRTEIVKVVENSLVNVSDANTKINGGQGTVADYKLIGITNVTEANLEDVNWYVKGKDNSTKSKLESNIGAILNALYYANMGNTSGFKTLGLEETNSNNYTAISNGLKEARNKKGSDLTRTEIVKVVEDALINVSDANTKINGGQGTVADYKLIGITNVTEANLEDVNWYVKGKDNSTKSKLESNIGAILNALYYANMGNTSGFKTLGLEETNSNNYTAISNGLKEARNKKGSDLTRTEVVKIVNEVNSTVNNVSLMMLDEEEQIYINKLDSDNLEKETNMNEIIQDEKDLEEEKQVKKDIVTEDINKIVETDNDFDSKQEEAVTEKQGAEMKEINIKDFNKQDDDDIKVVDINDEVDNQTIENIAV